MSTLTRLQGTEQALGFVEREYARLRDEVDELAEQQRVIQKKLQDLRHKRDLMKNAYEDLLIAVQAMRDGEPTP